MATTSEYLNDLVNQKNALADNLALKGVAADRSEKLNTLVPKVLKISGGEDSFYDDFWDTYQQNGNRYNYNYAFAGYGWTDAIYNPKYPFTGIKHCSSMFTNTAIKDTKQEFYFSDGYTGGMPFQYATGLVTIRTVHVTEKMNFLNANGADISFNSCSKLENITFSGVIGNSIDFKSCTLLSKESIENIISCLSDMAEGKTITFSLTAVNNAYETSDGAADGSTSSEWEQIKNTKSNWEIKTY